MAKKYNVAAMAASVMAPAKKKPKSMPMNEEAGETTPDNEMAEMAPKKTMKRQHPSSGKYKPSAMAAAAKPHPGFAALVKSGVPAGALANAARNASPAAKRANPRLNRVK